MYNKGIVEISTIYNHRAFNSWWSAQSAPVFQNGNSRNYCTTITYPQRIVLAPMGQLSTCSELIVNSSVEQLGGQSPQQSDPYWTASCGHHRPSFPGSQLHQITSILYFTTLLVVNRILRGSD